MRYFGELGEVVKRVSGEEPRQPTEEAYRAPRRLWGHPVIYGRGEGYARCGLLASLSLVSSGGEELAEAIGEDCKVWYIYDEGYTGAN